MKNNKFEWLFYNVKWKIRTRYFKISDRICNIILGKDSKRKINKYAGKRVFNEIETNHYIYDAIMSGKPCWIGRFGGTELSLITHFCKREIFKYTKNTEQELTNNLMFLSGFFPPDVESAKRFWKLMNSATYDIDLIGIWNLYMEEWYIRNFVKRDVCITRLTRLEPWLLYNMKDQMTEDDLPWTMALEGKKVLVVHPFEETIRNQYPKREMLFKDLGIGEVLPEFELITLKAVQTLASEKSKFSNWFEALDSMIEQCKKIKFDVAIVGCGAYGFPLAAEIKKMGKVAIHLGGATQLMFGICGKRWESGYNATCNKMINEYWTHPSECERIAKGKDVEGGCYW